MGAKVTFLVALISREALALTCAGLGAPLTDHSCFHAMHGPFVTVTATAGADPVSGTPQVDAVHTEYTVQLPASPATVTYQPLRSGLWVVFHAPSSVQLQVVDPVTQQPLAVPYSTPQTGCSALALAQVFELTALVRYTLRLVGGTAPSQKLVIEKLDDFLLTYAPDVDGDGFGSRADAIHTACVAPGGFIEDARDCDDRRADISPTAVEQCDGIDDDCDGRIDEGLGVGTACSAGIGACRVDGRTFCAAAGEVRCSAHAGSPGVEQCNGVDDNCDGVVDEGGDALCGTAEGPRCRSRGSTVGCGCTVDADCGGPTSGRICDDVRGVCADGCYRNEGRSGCAVPLLCSAVDPRQPGECVSTCMFDAHCTEAGRPACSGHPGPFAGCVACTSDAHCPSGVCRHETCVECAEDDTTHCRPSGSGTACLASATCGCRGHEDCSVEQFCDFERERCVPCPDWIMRSEAEEQARIDQATARPLGAQSCAAIPGLSPLALALWWVRRAKRKSALLVLAAVVAVSSCRDAALVRACTCFSPEICLAGACRRLCESTAECDPGSACHPRLNVCLKVESNVCRMNDGGCRMGVGELPVRHACQHAELGPFVDIQAEAVGAPAPPTMNVPQVVYRAALPATEGELAYVPTRDGPHVVFASAGAVSVVEGDTELAPEVVETLGTRCATLVHGASYVLRSGQTYRVRPRGNATVLLFVEHLGSFERPYTEVCSLADGGVLVE